MIDYQELLDRIASLERTVRNLGIGQELVLGSLHVLGDINADGELIGAVVADPIETNTVNERTDASGVTVDGVLLKDSEVTTDVINEKTGAAGVTIDGVLLKDYEILARKPPFNVKAWGAKGDNSTLDHSAINDAVTAAYNDGGGVVYFPALGTGANDRYKITEPIYLKEGVSFLGDHAAYSRISAHASDGSAYHAVDYSGSNPKGFFIKNLTIGFEDMYDNADARCIDFTSPAPSQYIVENVWLRNGYYGYYDGGGGFEAMFKRVWAYQCKTGFYKHGGGTGHQFYNCYAQGKGDSTWDSRGWDIEAGVGYLLQACAMDSYYSNTNSIALFALNHVLTINGFVMEDCRAETAGNRILDFDANYEVFASGIKDVSCIIKTDGGDNTRLVFIDKGRIHFSGCALGENTTCNGIANGGAGAGYAIEISGGTGNDMARVTFTASTISNVIQGTESPVVSAIRLGTALNTIQLTLDNVLVGTILNANANNIFDTTKEAWIAPSLLNSWVNLGGTAEVAGYFKDSFGVVHLKGMVKDGTIVAAIFQLPAGYRPAEDTYFSTTSNHAFGAVIVEPGGDVIARVGDNTWLSLGGLTFKAA